MRKFHTVQLENTKYLWSRKNVNWEIEGVIFWKTGIWHSKSVYFDFTYQSAISDEGPSFRNLGVQREESIIYYKKGRFLVKLQYGLGQPLIWSLMGKMDTKPSLREGG